MHSEALEYSDNDTINEAPFLHTCRHVFSFKDLNNTPDSKSILKLMGKVFPNPRNALEVLI